MHKRILVPLDGSDFSEAVLPHAISLAQELGAEIILLHVFPEPVKEFDTAASILSPPIELKQEQARIKRYMKDMCAKLEKQGACITYLIREGHVPEIILEVAKNLKADLIAMSTHGRTGLLHLLIGSVAEQVVHRSKILVALIRPQGEETGAS